MNWLSRQPLSRVLLLAAAWPTALVLYALWHIVAIWIESQGQAVVYGVYVSSWSGLTLILLTPPLSILALWAVARRFRPPAT